MWVMWLRNFTPFTLPCTGLVLRSPQGPTVDLAERTDKPGGRHCAPGSQHSAKGCRSPRGGKGALCSLSATPHCPPPHQLSQPPLAHTGTSMTLGFPDSSLSSFSSPRLPCKSQSLNGDARNQMPCAWDDEMCRKSSLAEVGGLFQHLRGQ